MQLGRHSIKPHNIAQEGDASAQQKGPTSQGLSYPAHPSLGVVNAPIMAVTKDHASVHHGSQPSQHRAPAVALYVYEAQQLRVLYVFPGNIASVGGQEAG